jgi:hypothetical protein
VAISIACEAPWLAGWVMREEYLFSFAAVEVVMGSITAKSLCAPLKHRISGIEAPTEECLTLTGESQRAHNVQKPMTNLSDIANSAPLT